MKPKNLIVTCGTSQILKFAPRKQESHDKAKEEIWKFISDLQLHERLQTAPHPSFLQSDEIEGWPEKIWAYCNPFWTDRIKNLGSEKNIFGAEISTLAAMEVENIEYAWNQDVDHFHLIASHSKSGLFAASAVATILRKGYCVGAERLAISMVPGLTTNTVDPEQAMYNLAIVVKEALKQDTRDQPWENIFVGSGGFKSTLPLLTLYSFLFGIPLVNTFELSSHLQRLSPRVDMENEASRKFWKNTWKNLKKQKWMSGDTSRYLQYIMDYRTGEAKDAKF